VVDRRAERLLDHARRPALEERCRYLRDAVDRHDAHARVEAARVRKLRDAREGPLEAKVAAEAFGPLAFEVADCRKRDAPRVRGRVARERRGVALPRVLAAADEGDPNRAVAAPHRFTPLARNPPSTMRTSPLTKLAASEERKIAAPTSSSTRPKRPAGVRSSSSRPRSVPSMSRALSAVRNTPGAIAFTHTPWRAHS